MNSRERVQVALSHNEPDQVPLDMGGTTVTSVTQVAYVNLRAYLRMPPDPDPVISNRAMGTVGLPEVSA